MTHRKSLSALYRQKRSILQEGFLSDCWVGMYRPAGSAKGTHTYYQLRSRKPLDNGKFARHLKTDELPHVRTLVRNGRLLQKVEKEIAKLDGKKLPARAVLTSSMSDEWYTPPLFVDLARNVMGGIDIDPASSERAQEWIQATTYYTQRENGLLRPWHGRLWLNPPYSQMRLWTEKTSTELVRGAVSEAVLLVRPAVGTAWYQALASRFPCCIPHKRIRFLNAEGREQRSPIHGNAFFYLGEDADKFRAVFSAVGVIIRPC